MKLSEQSHFLRHHQDHRLGTSTSQEITERVADLVEIARYFGILTISDAAMAMEHSAIAAHGTILQRRLAIIRVGNFLERFRNDVLPDLVERRNL